MTRGCPPARGLGEVLTTPHHKMYLVTKCSHRNSSGQGQVVGTCECSNEPSGSVKRGDFLD